MNTNDFASLMKSVSGLTEGQMKAIYKKLQGFVEANLKDMLVTACQFQIKETYNSLRLSKFAV